MSATSSPPTPVEQTTPKQMPLQPVTGPSALAGGRRRFMDLLWLMAVTEFKRTYFGTVLGYLWSLARPLLQFGVLLASRIILKGHNTSSSFTPAIAVNMFY